MKSSFSQKMTRMLKRVKIWLRSERHRFYVVGTFFLLMQLLVIYANYEADKYDVFFWFCNHTPILLAFSFFMNNKNFVKALINVGFIAQFLWTLDFLGKLFFGVYFMHITTYVFESTSGIYILAVIIIHILSTNLALYLTRKTKPNLNILFLSLVYVIFLFSMSVTYPDPARNVNCIYSFCSEGNFLSFPHYTNFWPVLMFFLVVLPTHGIQYLVYLWSRKKYKTGLSSS